MNINTQKQLTPDSIERFVGHVYKDGYIEFEENYYIATEFGNCWLLVAKNQMVGGWDFCRYFNDKKVFSVKRTAQGVSLKRALNAYNKELDALLTNVLRNQE